MSAELPTQSVEILQGPPEITAPSPTGRGGRFGRAIGAGLLVVGCTVATYAAEQVANPSVAEAAYDAGTGNYPWWDADHVPKPPAIDDLTWGYTDKATCDNKSVEFDCRSTKRGSYYFRDAWGFDLRNCTSYAAWRVAVEHGVNVGDWGSGGSWDDNATAYSIDAIPEVGDLAVWDGTAQNQYGHVAFVEAVLPQANGSTKVRIAEYNQQLDGKFRNDRVVVANKYIDINGANPANFKLKVGPEATSSPTSSLDPIPAVVERGNETAMVVVAPDKTLDYHFNPGGGGTWNRLDIPNADAKSTPAVIVRPDGELNIAAQGDDGSLDFHYNPSGTNTWGKIEIAGPNSAHSAPSIIQRPSGETNIVVQGPNNTLDFYFNAQGNPQWHKVTIPGGQAYSKPAVVQRPNGETNIAVLGQNNSMDFYWNTPGSPNWGKVPVAIGGWAMGAPSLVQRPTTGETVIAVQGQNHSLDIYINTAGQPQWGRIRAAEDNTTYNDTNPPMAVLRPSGELDIAVHGGGNSASVYYNAQGSTQWGQSLAAVGNYSLREPAMIQRTTGETNLVIVGPSNRLDYYMNSQGSPFWGVLPISGNNSAY